MLRFTWIAFGALAAALLRGLELLGLWGGAGARIAYALAAFGTALAYGFVRDGLRKNKAAVGLRFLCAWAGYGMVLLGALRLPFGSELQWRLSMGFEKEILEDGAAVLALSGIALCLPVLAKRAALPALHRTKTALMLTLGLGILFCALLLALSYGLELPAFVQDWAEPAAFLLSSAAYSLFALSLGKKVRTL